MPTRKMVLIWSVAAAVWFSLHTMLVLVVISKVVNEHEDTVHRINRHDSELSFMTSTDGISHQQIPFPVLTPSMDHVTIPKTSHSSRRKGAGTKHQSRVLKYVISSKQKHLLDQRLQSMLMSHHHPGPDYFGFNVTRSQELPLDRDIPDNRRYQCKTAKFDYSSLPTLSVVTPVHNEALTTLLRHVFAILHRTPSVLLKDIILVDDNSTFTYLGKDLEDYFAILDPRVRILRNQGREGLVMSRLHGADAASGDVLVFLDAHMEVGPGWSEPLLQRLNDQSKLVVQPDVPAIDAETFSYQVDGDPIFRGGFGWDMRYAWLFIPPYVHQMRTSFVDPIPTPVLVGCAIAVKKQYFNSIGGFDPGLQIWGGEHFDLSFRVWTSGGRIETVPCSKVGHVFKSNKYSYGPKGKNYVLTKNLMRVADIWMDEYKIFAYATARTLTESIPTFSEEELRSIEERRQLRRDLGCKSFQWYLKHIMPEIKIPSLNDIYFGEVTNRQTSGCFFAMDDGYIGVTHLCFKFRIIPENTFSIDRRGRMMFQGKCVGYDPHTLIAKLEDCSCVQQGGYHPRWTVSQHEQLAYTGTRGTLCASHVTSVTQVHKGQQVVQMLKCDSYDPYQKWKFMYKFTHTT